MMKSDYNCRNNKDFAAGSALSQAGKARVSKHRKFARRSFPEDTDKELYSSFQLWIGLSYKKAPSQFQTLLILHRKSFESW